MLVVRRACLPLLLAVAACNTTPPPPAGTQPEKTEPAEPTKAAEPEQPAEAKAPAGSTELTPEEIALIEADPKSLTPDQNRMRAYALRKKIMQNPNSEAAKTLEETRKAVLAGEIDPKAKPDPKDNGVVIPAPEYLQRTPDSSYGKPDVDEP